MNGHGKSDRSIVSKKSPNKVTSVAAEEMEKRDLAKGNLRRQNTFRTQGRADVQSALKRIRLAARRDKKGQFTALYHHVYNIDFLREAFYALKRKAAPGVDEVTWGDYHDDLEENLRDLSDRLKQGSYRAKAVRRVYIPKATGGERPLGVTALEDKIVQRATVAVMSTIYETDFVGFSYGFRPGRSQHKCSGALCLGIFKRKVGWVLDADIRGFFDAIDHDWMLRFLEHRIGDQRILRLVQKWLKAGVLEDGERHRTESGTPQGGSVSPFLANVYLHYVFDLWIQSWRRSKAKGDVVVVRWADDFIVGFQYEWEAKHFLAGLRERFRKFELDLHPEKTKLIEFGRYAASNRKRRGQRKPETFDFLGFTHICGKTLTGKFMVLRKTMKNRLRDKLKELKDELRKRINEPVPVIGRWLNQVVRGYFQYHAIPMNLKPLESFRQQVTRLWCRTLRRRSHKHKCSWQRMTRLAAKYLPHPRVLHPYPTQQFGVIT